MKTASRLKGMTLMEIVVSLAIYSVIALLLVQIMTTVNTVMRTTTMLNTRLAYEAKHADNRITDSDGKGIVDVKDNLNVRISFDGALEENGDALALNGNQYIYMYNNDDQVKDNDTTKNVHYKYMVFSNQNATEVEKPNTDEFQIPFVFKDFPYPSIHRVEVYLMNEDGTRGEQLSDNYFEGIAKTDDEGNVVLDANGRPVYEEGEEPIPRAAVNPSNLQVLVRAPRKYPEHTDDAKYKIQIVMYADIHERMHAGPTDVIYQRPAEGEEVGEGFPANDYPFFTFTITYCSFIKDAAEHVYQFSNPGYRFSVEPVTDDEGNTKFDAVKQSIDNKDPVHMNADGLPEF